MVVLEKEERPLASPDLVQVVAAEVRVKKVGVEGVHRLNVTFTRIIILMWDWGIPCILLPLTEVS